MFSVYHYRVYWLLYVAYLAETSEVATECQNYGISGLPAGLYLTADGQRTMV